MITYYLIQLKDELAVVANISQIDNYRLLAIAVTDQEITELGFTDNHQQIINQYKQIKGNKIMLANTLLFYDGSVTSLIDEIL